MNIEIEIEIEIEKKVLNMDHMFHVKHYSHEN